MSISKRLIGTPQEEGVGRRRIRRPASPSWRMAMLSPSRSGSAFQVLYKNASAHWDDSRGTTGNMNTSSFFIDISLLIPSRSGYVLEKNASAHWDD